MGKKLIYTYEMRKKKTDKRLFMKNVHFNQNGTESYAYFPSMCCPLHIQRAWESTIFGKVNDGIQK